MTMNCFSQKKNQLPQGAFEVLPSDFSSKEENTDTNVDLDKKEDTSSQGKVIGIKKK